MRMKKNLCKLTVLVMVAATVILSIPNYQTEAATTTYDVADYKGDRAEAEWMFPTQEGKIFAGWYTDDTYSTPYTATTGNATPKFVDAKVLTVNKQLKADTTSASDTTDIRFITSIDTLKFSLVGFDVTVSGDAGKKFDLQEKTAYTSIIADGQTIEEPSNIFGTSESAYFVTHSIIGVPKAVFGETITVEPYWYTLDGTKVYGTTRSFTIYDMKDGDIAPFDKFVGDYLSLSASHGTAKYTTEHKFGEEAGSLQLTVAKESEVYLTISYPYTKDISAYDYVIFRVYNPTDADIKVGTCWACDTICKAGEWTEVKIPVSYFLDGKVDALTGVDIPLTDISGIVIRFISGFEVGDCFYISAVTAGKNEVVEKEVPENVTVSFGEEADLNCVGLHWNTAHNIALDTTMKHGDDAGSLKVTLVTTNDNYIILKAPYNTDFSAYDYISFWVYNAGNADFKMGTTWAADTICVAGEWTQVIITKEMFEANKVKDMSSNVLTMADVTNLPLRIFGTSSLAAGDCFYISSVTAGNNVE